MTSLAKEIKGLNKKDIIVRPCPIISLSDMYTVSLTAFNFRRPQLDPMYHIYSGIAPLYSSIYNESYILNTLQEIITLLQIQLGSGQSVQLQWNPLYPENHFNQLSPSNFQPIFVCLASYCQDILRFSILETTVGFLEKHYHYRITTKGWDEYVKVLSS